MNTTHIILGNFFSLLAMVSDSISSTQKTAKRVLMVQNISQLFYCACTLVLKGYSGAVQNVVSVIRNLIAINDVKCKWLEWFLILLGVVLGICFNNLGLVGYLPIIANLLYTVAVFRFNNNERALKSCFAICVFLFSIFNLTILNFVGCISNLVIMITTLVMLFKKK